MIDTVILRLHDLNKYEYVITRLNVVNNNGYSVTTGKVPTSEIAQLRREGVKETKEILEILQNKRSGDFLLKTQVGKQMNASNHYAFTYFINYTKNFIEFNFSIPKYKYGTNIIMFGYHLMDKEFVYYKAQDLEYNIEVAYTRFYSFIKGFFAREFSLNDIDFKDLEVNRIDVCFNQVFNSRSEALLYLDYQKRLKKKYARDEDGVMRDYTTSMMYITKRYSAKIYHKGSEYEKNDIKEHKKYNTDYKSQYFNTGLLQEFSDKILRYELTLRTGYLNYLHKQNLFRKKCSMYQTAYRHYVEIDAVKQRNERISKAIGRLPDNEKEKYRALHPYQKISKDGLLAHKRISKIISKRRLFTIDADILTTMYNKRTVDYETDKVLFSGALLRLCLGKLVKFIQDFQITELPDEDRLRMSIGQYNRYHSPALPMSEMCIFYSQLLKHGSFKEVRKYCHYSKATIYRYIERFKKVGITENSLTVIDTGYNVPYASMDLKDYHSTIIHKSELLQLTKK